MFVFSALVLSLSILSPLTGTAAPGDYAWSKVDSIIGDQVRWESIASSDDGSKLAMTSDGGYIYTSDNYGQTWTERLSAGYHDWGSIASSADGTKLVAVVNWGGYVYTSDDSGATWIERTSAGARDWESIASSADGTKLVAATYNGYIYTSTDSGATWTEQTSAGSRNWYSIASSADGNRLAAVVGWGGYIYTSDDSGVTWIEQVSAGNRQWHSIDSSDDGRVLVAGVYGNGGYIYTSTDYGQTWIEHTTPGVRGWVSVTSSSDGSNLAAVSYNGPIYLASPEGPATDTINLSDLPLSSNQATNSAISNSTLSATSMQCYNFDQSTIRTLDSSGVSSPRSDISIVGGVEFTLDCTSPGGSADVSLLLGAHYADTSKVRVYKGSSGGSTLTDITSQVTISNQTVAGATRTVIAYSLIDGADLDEDGLVNGSIVDPLYVGVLAGTTPVDPESGQGELADTGSDAMLLLLMGAASMLVGFGLVPFARR